VQGQEDNPFASFRSRPYPMPPGVPMYLGLLLSEGCRRTTTFPGGAPTPHAFPSAITSRFYGTAPNQRPPCVDCGLCSGFGCPNNAKGAPSVVTIRQALLTGRCQLRYNAQAVKLVNDGGRVTAVEYLDGEGVRQTATADAFVLAASAIESARLCLLSTTPGGGALGNASDLVGRNLMFHLQNNVNGFLPHRVHGQRGRAVTHGTTDFRGVEPGGQAVRVFDVGGTKSVNLGGICEFSASQGQPITEDGSVYAIQLPLARRGLALKNAMRDQPIGQHLFGLLMQAEDAPQLGNRIDLDPTVRDVFGQPVARVTYQNHPFELQARCFYLPYMKDVVRNAGATQVFLAPLLGDPPSSRHVLGTLRMGADPATSVTRPDGRFHEVENLYACDGSVFVTSSGYNPTLTIMAMALRIAHGIAGTPAAIA
jgi:gluconate 2-dehydrogenase alpha chain